MKPLNPENLIEKIKEAWTPDAKTATEADQSFEVNRSKDLWLICSELLTRIDKIESVLKENGIL